MSKLDTAFTAAVTLIGDAEPRLASIVTEEDAKIQLITRFLTEVLEWQHADLSNERKNDNGYSDYIVSDNDRAVFVIEAKRQGALTIDTRATKMQAYKIAGPALAPAMEGIEQAASYCAPLGIQLAILTDGIRWVFFKPFIVGEQYKSKEAIVFPCLSSIIENFSTFYDLASKSGIRQGLHKLIFDKIHQNRTLLTQGLSAAFSEADIHPEQKSQLAFDLEKVFSAFFSGLAGDDDPDLLVECFVETKESRVADFALEKITTNVLGNLAPEGQSVDAGLHALIESTIAAEHGETVYIVGPPGAGKSTFLERFFKKTLPANIRERCVVVNINALDATGDEETAVTWFTNKVIELIETQIFEGGHPQWEDLLGLYHLEYVRRSDGVDALLYKRDKAAFKEKFSSFMDEQVEMDREGYLKRLLTDVVKNRKRLPIFVIDNTDEFPIKYKEAVFQYFQALRRHAKYCLLVFPATDKSAWAFSKTEIFNIYSSRSYFLPTPSPREVFRKRVEYLRKSIDKASKTKAKGDYAIGRGIKVSIGDLGGFASTVEHIFVDQDFISRRIGTLANYNIRKTLSAARRVMTSAVLNIDDLIKSYLLGQDASLSPNKFMQALLKGDYNYYKRADNHFVFPIFDVDDEVRQSPLLHVRVLALLKATHDVRSTDDSRYLSVSSILQYFDNVGFSELPVERSLAVLMGASLVEPYDSSVGHLNQAQRLAITHSGLTHLEMALFNPVFLEQMALTTRVPNGEVATELRRAHLASQSAPQRARNVREVFARYLIAEDASLGKIPQADHYNVQHAVSEDIRKYSDGTSDEVLEGRDSVGQNGQSGQNGVIATKVEATVDWFDSGKGYGFATVEQLGGAFLHISVLEKSGIQEVHEGDRLACDISRGNKGFSVAWVYKHMPSGPLRLKKYSSTIIKVFKERGYGFVHIADRNDDAFFHFSVVPHKYRSLIQVGQQIEVEVDLDRIGRGGQVKRIISIGEK